MPVTPISEHGPHLGMFFESGMTGVEVFGLACMRKPIVIESEQVDRRDAHVDRQHHAELRDVHDSRNGLSEVEIVNLAGAEIAMKRNVITSLRRQQSMFLDDLECGQRNEEGRLRDARRQRVKKFLHHRRTVKQKRIAEAVVGWLPLFNDGVFPEAAECEGNVVAEWR